MSSKRNKCSICNKPKEKKQGLVCKACDKKIDKLPTYTENS